MELRLLPIFSLFALRVVTAQGLPQMCYIDANQLAPDFIIPCWTSYSTPHYSCCMVGDKCLHQNACYNLSTGITYEYGCTDPSYKDDNCPSKCNLDRKKSNWAGLLFCDGTNGTPKDTWVCNEPDNCHNCPDHTPWDPRLEKLSRTSCDDIKNDGKYVAFSHTKSISDMVALPAASDILEYYALNADRWDTSPSASAASASSNAPVSTPVSAPSSWTTPSSSIPTAASTTTPSPPNHRPKTVALAAGVGVTLSLLAIVAVLYFIWRRKQHQEQRVEPFEPPHDDSKGPSLGIDIKSGSWGYAHKAELPGDAVPPPIVEVHGTSSQIFEMEGSTTGERVPLQSPVVSPLLSQYSDRGDGREHRISGIDGI